VAKVLVRGQPRPHDTSCGDGQGRELDEGGNECEPPEEHGKRKRSGVSRSFKVQASGDKTKEATRGIHWRPPERTGHARPWADINKRGSTRESKLHAWRHEVSVLASPEATSGVGT